LGWLVLQWSAFVIAAAVLAGAVVLLYAPDASAYGLNSVALFSLAVSALAGALAIAIYRQQALQADRDASRHSRLLASIAQSASSAADSADRAHINTDAILRRLNAAQEVKTGNAI